MKLKQPAENLMPETHVLETSTFLSVIARE